MLVEELGENANIDKNNEDINHVVVDEFLGCDVVLDADQTMDDV